MTTGKLQMGCGYKLQQEYDAVSANVIILVRKLDEIESGQMVFQKVK